MKLDRRTLLVGGLAAPFVGQKLARIAGKEHATSLIALCIVAAQVVMVPMAMLVGRKADSWGRKPIFLAAFAVLAIRGALYPVSDDPAWLVTVLFTMPAGSGVAA